MTLLGLSDENRRGPRERYRHGDQDGDRNRARHILSGRNQIKFNAVIFIDHKKKVRPFEEENVRPMAEAIRDVDRPRWPSIAQFKNRHFCRK